MKKQNAEQTEKEILSLFWNRDENAITAFTSYDGKRCYRIALGILDDEGYAEECLSDLCLKLWNSIPPEKPESLCAYACRIIQNLALNLLKKQNAQKRSAILTELDETVEGIPDMEPDETADYIRRFLSDQSKIFSLIFIRRYFYSDSVGHIAELTGFSEKKVSKILSGMKKDLRKYLLKGGIVV